MTWGSVRFDFFSLPVVSYFYLSKVVESVLLLCLCLYTSICTFASHLCSYVISLLLRDSKLNIIFLVDDILRFGKYRSTFFHNLFLHFMDQTTTRLIERTTGGLSDDENSCRVPIFHCNVTLHKHNVKRGEWFACRPIKTLSVACSHSFSKLPRTHPILWYICGTAVTYQSILIPLS